MDNKSVDSYDFSPFIIWSSKFQILSEKRKEMISLEIMAFESNES